MNYLRSFFLGVVAVAILAMMGSCTGYPEGPGISFTSALTKIATTWRVKSAIENGADVPARYESEFFQFKENGKFETLEATSSISIPPFTQDTVIAVKGLGDWKFVNEESAVEMLYAYSYEDPFNTDVTYREEVNERYDILRLSQDELWLRNDSIFLKLAFFTE